MFDANSFLSQPSAPLATKFEVVDEGEYEMSLEDDLKVEEISFTDRNGNPAVFYNMTLTCNIHNDAMKQKMGRDKVTVRMRIPLDLDANGKLETGPNKNVRLGQLRDVLGQNNDGWTPAQLKSAPVKFIGKVTHSSDKKDPTIKYADVTKVSKISA